MFIRVLKISLAFILPVMAEDEGPQGLEEEKVLFANSFDEFLRVQTYRFAQSLDTPNDQLENKFRIQLEKTHDVWMSWAKEEAKANALYERSEEKFFLTNLIYQKRLAYQKEIGGPDNFQPVVIDDPRVNLRSMGMFDQEYYRGTIGGSEGYFALQWYKPNGVRGVFSSDDSSTDYRLFGRLSEENRLSLLVIEFGSDSGKDALLQTSRPKGKSEWKGSGNGLGNISMKKLVFDASDEVDLSEKKKSTYDARLDRSRIGVNLEWEKGRTLEGSWLEKRTGVPGSLHGVNPVEGDLLLNQLKQNPDVEGGEELAAFWFLKKISSDPVIWSGRCLQVNGYQTEVSLRKAP